MLEQLQQKNTHIMIKSVNDDTFKAYGTVHKNLHINSLLQFLYSTTVEEHEVYIPHLDSLASLSEAQYIEDYLFGQISCNVGYFNAYNSKLNALEYHKCSEVLVFATDVVLLLAKIEQIQQDQLDSKNIVAFYASKGSVVELYATSLHFAPCMATSAGIQQIVFLSKNTNTPLVKSISDKNGENKFLFGRNKWVLAHQEATSLVSSGAYIGITGKNIHINFIEI
ncbi:MAG: DUF4867 family protein [Brevinema sp.]